MITRLLQSIVVAGLLVAGALGQDALLPEQTATTPAETAEGPAAPRQVEVEPTVRDEQIAERLERILQATGWFEEPQVRVDEGVVFLHGLTEDEQYKRWAGDLARNTQDVVAVVNQIELLQPNPWDFAPARAGIRELVSGVIASVPFILFALVTLIIAWLLGKLCARLVRAFTRSRVESGLLRTVLARAVGVLVFLLGVYIVLRVVGLTRLAVTVLGGTGLIGLIIGIAFRDITENFLASIFLSMQNPFRAGDLVEIEGVLGFVQRLTTRSTIVMTLDGNHVQIPNSTVYKSAIYNYTSNPNRRLDFVIGIGYEDSVPHAQEVALQVLREHPAVLREPEPWVLVDQLGSATISLRVYFWLDGTKHSWLKVRSSVMRLVKRAFQDAGISMPDEAREVIFPRGVPVQLLREKQAPAGTPEPQRQRAAVPSETDQVSTQAEAGLASEAGEIEQQARHARLPEQGANLLADGALQGPPHAG